MRWGLDQRFAAWMAATWVGALLVELSLPSLVLLATMPAGSDRLRFAAEGLEAMPTALPGIALLGLAAATVMGIIAAPFWSIAWRFLPRTGWPTRRAAVAVALLLTVLQAGVLAFLVERQSWDHEVGSWLRHWLLCAAGSAPLIAMFAAHRVYR